MDRQPMLTKPMLTDEQLKRIDQIIAALRTLADTLTPFVKTFYDTEEKFQAFADTASTLQDIGEDDESQSEP